jgi:hypothetical protein
MFDQRRGRIGFLVLQRKRGNVDDLSPRGRRVQADAEGAQREEEIDGGIRGRIRRFHRGFGVR